MVERFTVFSGERPTASHCASNRSIAMWTVIYLSLLTWPMVKAAELSVSVSEPSLTLAVNNIEYPKDLLEKELKSGLPNDINLIVSIEQQGKPIYGTTVNYKITYDLWDEIYQVRIQGAEHVLTECRVAQNDITEFMTSFTITSKEAFQLLGLEQSYLAQVRILVNPVKTERINKIKTWIANSQGHTVDSEANNNSLLVANTTPVSQHQSSQSAVNRPTFTPTVGSARPRFQKLFDQILEQYIREDEIPALWSSEVLTAEFSLDPLTNDTKNH